MKKNIVVVYWGDDWKLDVPLRKAEPTRKSFEDWHDRGLKHGIEMYRASMKWYDLKTNHFQKAWAYRNGRWIKVRKPIKPDMIFDKIMSSRDYQLFGLKMKAAQKTKFFNHPLFRAMYDNKLSQYLILSQFMPKSYLAINSDEFKAAVKKIKSSKVVVKPLYGSGGFGIKIDMKNKVLRAKVKYPVFVQEFIKSQKGIPGFSKKNEVADLRMVYINHKLIYSLSRIAKKGSLFTNFHQGATALLVPKNKIPKKAAKMAADIVKILKSFKQAHYSLDFIFTNTGKPILLEMNTTPGFDLLYIVGDEKIKARNFRAFISTVK